MWLDKFAAESHELGQIELFKEFLELATPDDLRFLIRLMKHDLRMGAGPKNILDGLHPLAYESWQKQSDLKSVSSLNATSIVDVSSCALFTAIKPMLCSAASNSQEVCKKFPRGFFAEIKYDGERVQIHFNGSEWKFFSRSLKPVVPVKVSEIKSFLPSSFSGATSLILDAEILLVDTLTDIPLPFGYFLFCLLFIYLELLVHIKEI